ncbi:MAG: hypothetical protein HC798_03245 [Polaribacter sp.]|nr:hypothetical protein [Polaribacter sp.]
MNQQLLQLELLQKVNATKVSRANFADFILTNKMLFPYLVDEVFNVQHTTHIKAAWILEWICTNNGIEKILPHLNQFISKLTHIKDESALRPCAKICEQLANIHHQKKRDKNTYILNNQQIESLISISFDWLLDKKSIAVKAYTMQTLFYLGFYEKWVHSELANIIHTKLIFESKGCAARGKKILNQIQKLQ